MSNLIPLKGCSSRVFCVRSRYINGVISIVNRYIKTFYLWLCVATLCNLVGLVAGLVWDTIPEGAVLLYPAAWLMQLPLILILSLLHHAINQLLQLLPDRHIMRAQGVACSIIMFLFTGIYLASQVMRIEINSFLSWDLLGIALSDSKQVLPDVGRRIGIHLLGLSVFSIALGQYYTRRYQNALIEHSGAKFAMVLLAIGFSATSSYSISFRSVKASAWRARNEILPTTYLTASLVEDILLESRLHDEAIESLIIQPQVAMDDYLENAQPATTPNIIFIMLESVPWDHFGFMGYERTGITPNLDAFADNSLLFPRTYAPANHSNYSQPAVHSSQYPLRSKSLDQFQDVDYPKTMLFDILSATGYQTAFISAQNEDWLGMKRFIFANTTLQYFLHSKDELGSNIGSEDKIDDSLVCTRTLEYLDERNPDQPVFLYVNFQRTHFPYDIPEDAPRPYQPCSTDDFEFSFFSYDQDHTDVVVNKFDNALHYVDAQVGRLMDYLKANDLYENSLIIVSSDHGEAFYRHGSPTHSTSLYDDQIRVSTLIKQPNQIDPVVRYDAISLIDINPTILEVLGMNNHPSFQGQPVLRKPRSNPIYFLSHGLVKGIGIVDYPWKYVASETSPPRLINLESDPAESTNVSSEYPERVEEMKKQMEIFRQQQLYYYLNMPSEERGMNYPPRL